MPDVRVDRIQEFPQDGRLWWVRWVDRYRPLNRGTATPGVEVLLSPLDLSLAELGRANIREIVDPKREQGSSVQAPIPVFTGFIPRLPIGTVFLDGVEVASLPFKKAKFNLKNFTISVCNISDQLDTKPGWWAENSPYRVINRGEFYLAMFPHAWKSQAVVIRSEEVTIVLPCHEVFRAIYAPHSEIAQALTMGPWDLTKDKVINPHETLQRSDGNWQVTLRRRIPDHFSNLVANLCLSASGKAAANSIYTGLLRSDGPGYMKAAIPFELENLRLTVRGISCAGNPDKFLAFQLMAMDFPDLPAIAPLRDNSGEKGRTQTRVPKDRPYSARVATPNSDEDGIVDANSEEDPHANSVVTTFVLPSVQWGNQPQQIKELKAESYIYEGSRCGSDPGELNGVSPGTAWNGDTDLGSGAYSAEQTPRDQSERMEEVITMFERLLSSGRIRDWEAVPHPRPLLHANGVPLWHLPRYAKDIKRALAFAYLHRSSPQRRGALVCKLQIQSHTIYWLEIELRAEESGRRALIYSVDESDFFEATSQLLEIAAMTRGNWPSSEDLLCSGVSAVETWTHSFIGKDKKGKGGRLNDHRAIDAMSKLVTMISRQTDRQHLYAG